MKMPPKHRRVMRIVYRIAQVFFPKPFRDCYTMTAEQRVASHHIRLGRHKAKKPADNTNFCWANTTPANTCGESTFNAYGKTCRVTSRACIANPHYRGKFNESCR